MSLKPPPLRRTWLQIIAEINPIWLTGVFIACGMAMPAVFIFFPTINANARHFVSLAILIMVILPIAFTVINVVHSHRRTYNIFHLAFLYAQIVVVFGVLYLCLISVNRNRQLHAQATPGPTIAGITATWVDALANPDNHDRGAILVTYLGELHDCIHFSLVTSATVGYGDMVPVTRLARLAVDLQIAMTIFFVTFGIGTFFIRRDQESRRP